MQRLTFAAALAALLLGTSAPAAPPPQWTRGLVWHLDQSASTRFVFMKQIGPGVIIRTKDDTRKIVFDTYGLHVVTRSSRWKAVDLRRWLPADARAVRLSFQTVISRGKSEGNAVLYASVKEPGSRCCVGPPGFRSYPVDYSYRGNVFHEGEVAHGVVLTPGDETRQFSSAEVLVHNGRFMFSWGYRKMAEDALAIGVYLVGYAS